MKVEFNDMEKWKKYRENQQNPKKVLWKKNLNWTTLARIVKKKKRKTQIAKIRNEKRDITTEPPDI